MAKAIAKLENIQVQDNEVCASYSPVLSSGEAWNSNGCGKINATITAAQINNVIRSKIAAEALAQYGVTLGNNDVILIGGAV